MRKVYQPSLDDSWGAVPIDNGGSSSKKLPTAIQYLGLLTNSSMGTEHGSADLDANGKVKHINLPDSIISEVVNVSGPSSLKINQTGIYTITDFDSAMNYVIAAISGIVTRNGDTITYTADASPGNGGFTLNGKAYIIPVTYYSVVTPNVTSPTNGQSGLSGTVNFSSNAFAMEGGTDTHQVSDWQLSTQANFATLVNSTSGDSGNKTSWTVSNLNPNTSYYVRVRYKGVVSEYSDWSPVINFTTSATFAPNAPVIMTPSDGETGVAIAPTIVAGPFNSPGIDEHYSTDWQISTDSIFSNIISSATDDTLNKYVWNVTGLSDLTQYYIRARYKGSTYGYGAWSATVGFVTIQANSINTPSISSPANASDGNSLSPSLSSSVFTVTGGSDTHQSTDWQIATDSGFTNIVKSTTGDTVNKTSWSVTGLTPGLIYYVRVRYKGAALPYSAWSTTSHFGTIHLNTPSITSPTTGATGLMPSMTLSGSAFGVTGASDTHASSTWQIATDPGFTNIAVESVNSTTNKTSWTVNLNLNTTYYARVRYTGTTYGTSNWSSTISFSTVANYSPNTPSITSPTGGATNQGPKVSFTSSAFVMSGGTATHTSTDWQVASDNGFATIVSSATDDTTNKVSWTSGNLTVNTTFYARVRYKASNGIYSAWSNVISFTTKPTYLPINEEAIISGGSSTTYGVSMSMDDTGTRLVVGDDSLIYGYYNYGAVYIYSKASGSWVLEAAFTGYPANYTAGGTNYIGTPAVGQPNPVYSDQAFGNTVSISGDGSRIIIGAKQFQGYSGYSCGRVLILVRSGTTWTIEKQIYGNYNSSDQWGTNVCISKDGAFIAFSDRYAGGGYIVGRVIVYSRSGTTWSLIVYNLGFSKVMQGTHADVGSDIKFSRDNSRIFIVEGYLGYVYVYALSGGTSYQYESTISLGYTRSYSKMTVNNDGSMFLIGITSANKVLMYSRSGTTWSLTTNFQAASPITGEAFGSSVSMNSSGDTVLVGAFKAVINGVQQGRAFIFTRSGNNWSQQAVITPAVQVAGNFGRIVELANDLSRAAITSNGTDYVSGIVGKVYLEF